MSIYEHKQNTVQYFNVIEKELSDGNVLYIIDLEEITSDLKNFIDQQITVIHSVNDYTIEGTKKILRKTFNTDQKPYDVSDVKMGAIAEFFVHLFFSHLGFKQECLFKNLEELHGIKKGHDGYYSYKNEGWIMESKSSRTNEDHVDNIKKAYKDISKKVSGKSDNKNNPWDNALNHAKLAKTDEDILNNIRKLSEDFINDIFHDVSEFNVIPSSTVFFNGNWKKIDHEDVFNKINSYVPNMSYQKINVVCITQRTVNLFLDYLGEQ